MKPQRTGMTRRKPTVRGWEASLGLGRTHSQNSQVIQSSIPTDPCMGVCTGVFLTLPKVSEKLSLSA